MSFHDSYMSAKFFIGCFGPLILGFMFLIMPGVERWRAIPAFLFSGVLFWLYFRTHNGSEEPTAESEDAHMDD